MTPKELDAKNEALVKLYFDSGMRLLDLLRTLEDGTQRRKVEQLILQIESSINALTAQASSQMAEILGLAYRLGADEMVRSLASQGIANVDNSLRSIVHRRAVQAIMDDAFYSILEASNNMAQDAKDRIRDIVRTANQRSLLEGVSKREATREAIAAATQTGIRGIVTANGANIPVEKYMSGVVHYHQRKAHVTGAEELAKETGIDLVYVNYVGITCEYCAKYQGRVYSISGNDPRFPKLEVRPPFHSHCVHSLSAYVEEYHSAEETQRMIEQSNRPFIDNRTEANIRRYEELQKEKRKLNEDRKQWIRYRAVLQDETPKSFAAFRRMKYNNSEGWQKLQGKYRKINAYNKAVANEPRITADLRDISKSTGVEMVGLEFRIKSKASYLRKVNIDSKGSADLQVINDVISGTNDVIRYTYKAESDKLVDAYFKVHHQLESKGYKQFKLKNTWLVQGNPYKGINANYRSPDGQSFEIQFHTPESFELKNGELHTLYEKWRTMPNKADLEAIKLSKQMSEMSSKLKVPDRIEEVK